jgi:hypothetical protein
MTREAGAGSSTLSEPPPQAQINGDIPFIRS